VSEQAQSPDTEVRIELKADTLRSDVVRGLVWFVNYAAIDPTAVKAEKLDLHGAAMLPEDVELFAHRWLAFSRSIDIQHDGIGRPIHVVESFFNSKEISSPSWPVDAHAVRLNLSACKEAMEGFSAGRLNCVSLDAFTFNVRKRLPVATTKALAMARPADPIGVAREIAQLGFPGVTGVCDIGGGLMIVQRGALPPVAVQVSDEEYEVTAGGGVWSTLAARLMTNGTLTVASTANASPIESVIPDHGGVTFAVDFRPWDPAEVEKLLKPTGVDLSGSEPVSPFAFLRADGTGEIPHHTIRGVSAQAVQDGLGLVDKRVPAEHRAAVRLHLMKHLMEAA
jgi:hypothetical protein